MERNVFICDEICIKSKPNKINFFRLKSDIEEIISTSKIMNGIILIQSLHTTCSVFFEEMVHDVDDMNYEYLQRDLLRGLNKLFPKQLMYDDYYDYPGIKHREYCEEKFIEYQRNPQILLNADAHLKATIIGESVSLIIKNGVLQTGEFGEVYFVDFDCNRERNRKCLVAIYGE